jgi:hypothetical protein
MENSTFPLGRHTVCLLQSWLSLQEVPVPWGQVLGPSVFLCQDPQSLGVTCSPCSQRHPVSVILTEGFCEAEETEA